ncbi:MAG TPA: tetratricopeptide repeat protein [Vicinamibacterales bacterium]|jgi:tetratricopeptide (TPR) repeat protein|nr:tetratricopeptide repeat protein [Vicinamibacterales bacterium]
MKLESVIYAISGVFFGLIVGWMIGSQQAQLAPRPAATQAQSAPQQASTASESSTPAPAMLDETKARALESVAERDPKNAVARSQLGDLYYDAGKYPEAIKWYQESLSLNPKDVNVSTDLGVSYYYNKETDRALEQLQHSLEIDPTHAKTLLNLGVVRAFGKRDLKGATEAWQKLVEVAPQSPEGQQAKQALDSLSSAHGNIGQ